MSVPAAFAAGAHFDDLLQAALRRFYPRAVLETESVISLSSSGRLSMDPTSDPAALAVRWFGARHVLRVPEQQPFSVHEVRLARAIGAVLSARYRAVFEPQLMMQRPELFQGSIEDRYVGAFLDAGIYAAEKGGSRADLIASAIEVLRVAALSSYENRPIASGVLLLDADDDPCGAPTPEWALYYAQPLTSIKAFYRLCNGLQTLFLVARDGRLLTTVDVERWAGQLRGAAPLLAPCARVYAPHARTTQGNRHVCVLLSPSHEIKVFAEGAQVFAFRNARWHLLDLEAHYETWAASVGNRSLAETLFQAALDLADARQGALFVVLRNPDEAIPKLLVPGDRLLPDATAGHSTANRTRRRELLSLLATSDVSALDLSVLEGLAGLDGATVVDRQGHVIAAGAILRHPPGEPGVGDRVEGARTTAALTASRYGPVLKVSEDGLISFFDGDKHWEI